MSGFRPYWGSNCYIIAFVLLLLSLRTEVGNAEDNHNGYYMVSAAGTIFSERPYGVVVGMFESKASCSCEVFLKGPSINMSIEMHLTPLNPISSYQFELPELMQGEYWLTVKSLRGMNFTDKTRLTWDNFKNFVKIQTSKPIYRPGQLLQFRVVFHNETLHAVSPEFKAFIWIEDGRGYRVMVYKEIDVNKGVFQSDLRISRYPNLGRWRICVRNGLTVKETCAFIQVQEDDVSSQGIANTTIMNAVTLKNAAETAWPILHAQHVQPRRQVQHRRRYRPKRSPKSEEQSNQKEDTEVNNIFANSSSDDLSNITITARARPMKRNENLILIDYGAPKGIPQMVKFQFDYKLSYAICVVMFNGLILASRLIYPDRSNNFVFEVQLTVNTWPFVHVFIYGMESNSNVLHVATHTIEVERLNHDHVEIEAPSEVRPGEEIAIRIKAIPKSYLGLLVTDSHVFENNDNNDLSFSYLNAVKSALTAGSPNKPLNETPTAFNLGLITLTNADSVTEAKIRIVDKTVTNIPQLAFKTKTINARTEAETEELAPKLRTNLFHNSRTPNPLKRSPTADSNCCDVPPVRAEANDVWIFDSIEDTKAGWRNWTTRVPDGITNWRLNAFTVDPHAGLTLLGDKPFIDIRSTKPLYLQYSVPQHIKVGELLTLPVNCFNRLNKQLDVTIRVQNNVSQYQLLDDDRNPLFDSPNVEMELSVKSNDSSSLNIYLRAIKTGIFDLSITAISGTLNDKKIRQIKVLQPGLLISHQVVAFESLGWRNMKSVFQLKLPHQPTNDGVKCFLSGNMIAANIQGYNSIDRMDSGEHLITKLLATYYLWDYVSDQTWISKRWRQFLADELNDGFQSLLRMRARDGGYSYEEQPTSSCNSVWLTAYALYTLHMIDMTPVKFDRRLMTQSENYLLRRRVKRIQFVDKCVTPQRRKLDQLELSIDVMKVMQLSTRMIRIQETHSWISKQLQIHNNYHLEAKRAHNIPEWKRPDEQTTGNWSEYRRNIETAARILTGQIKRKNVPQFEIYKWLIPKLYGEPCKVECFECFIARQAIYNYIRAPSKDLPLFLNVTMWGDISQQKMITINVTNQWQAQKVQLYAQNQTLNFKSVGVGELLVRCYYEYDPKDQVNYPNHTQKQNKYELKVTQLNATRSSDCYFKFCVQRHKIDREYYIGSEVAFHLPSGYVLGPKSASRLVAFQIVIQASSEDGNTKMLVRLGVLQLNILTCMSVLATRLYKVDNLQPGMLSVYDTNSLQKPEVLAYEVSL